MSGTSIVFVADSGEVNDVVVSDSAGLITIRDTSTPITASPEFTVVSPNEVTIPSAGFFLISLSLADQDDSLDASGLSTASGLSRTVIHGGDGNDTLVGSDLDDFFTESLGSDFVDGGGAVRANQWAVSFDSDMTLTDTTLTIGSDVDTYANLQAVTLGGGDGDNIIDASAATPASGITGLIFNGRLGDDTLIGGTTRDIFQDREGNNTFVGGANTNDSIFFISDQDQSVDDSTVTVGTSVSTHTGIETVDLWGGPSDNVIDASGVTASSGFTFVQIQGFDGNDTLTGSALSDRIRDSGGANVVDGGAGNDELILQADADQTLTNTTFSIAGDVSSHTNLERILLNGGNSDNTIDASALDASSGVDFVSIQGLDGNDTLLGSQVVDEIRSRGGNNFIDGGSSPANTRDRVVFFQDEDVFASDAQVVVGTGINTLSNVEDLRIIGQGSDNTLDASALTATSGIAFLLLSGSGGNDILRPSSDLTIVNSMDGGAGTDELDFSLANFVPTITINGSGSIDGDAGSFTYDGNTFGAMNNIDAITLPSVYDFSSATYSAVEGDSTTTTSVVQVNRSINTAIASSVDVVLTSGTASAGTDFVAGPVTLSFAPGETTKSVPIEILGETIVELDETLQLSFEEGIAGTANPMATLTIANDDSATIAVADVSQVETNSGQTAFEFVVTLSAPVDTNVSLQADTQDDTTQSSDYVALVAESVNFVPSTVAGTQSQTVTVMVNGDTDSEPDEAFFLNLSALNAGGRDVSFADAQGLGTILNDDVSNVAPELLSIETDATFADKGTPGELVTLTASFADANANDAHTATIDWGDGTISAGSVNQTTGEVTATHEYLTGGVFVASINISDGTDTDVASATAVVSGVRLTNLGELQIVGTDGRDWVRVKEKRGDVVVKLRSGHSATQTESFAASSVSSLAIYTCDGNDHVYVHRNVDVPAWIDAGDGHDHVIGGSGDDTIRGGRGRDHLFGGAGSDIILGGEGRDWIKGDGGRDILIGNAGHDFVFGGRHQDILIGDSTIHDDDDIALAAIRSEWNAAKPYSVRKQNLVDGTGDNSGANQAYYLNALSLIDLNEFDLLCGGFSFDWLLH